METHLDPRVHRRARRLADVRRRRSRELPAERIATVVGRYYAMDRDARWERTAARARRDRRRARAPRDDPVEAVRASYDGGVTDEFIEPVVLDGRPRLDPATTRRSSSTSGPTARASSSRAAARRRHRPDTMTRYRDDLDAPVVVRRADVPETLAEVLARARRSPAARGRDREVRARHLLLQRRRRAGVGGRDAHPRAVARATSRATTSSRRCRRARSPQRFVAEIGNGYRFAVSTSRTRTWSGTRASIPAVTTAVEASTRASARSSTATDAAGRCLPGHRRPRQRGADARAGRRQPAHGAHDEPRAARPHRRGSTRSGRAAGSPI